MFPGSTDSCVSSPDSEAQVLSPIPIPPERDIMDVLPPDDSLGSLDSVRCVALYLLALFSDSIISFKSRFVMFNS